MYEPQCRRHFTANVDNIRYSANSTANPTVQTTSSTRNQQFKFRYFHQINEVKMQKKQHILQRLQLLSHHQVHPKAQNTKPLNQLHRLHKMKDSFEIMDLQHFGEEHHHFPQFQRQSLGNNSSVMERHIDSKEKIRLVLEEHQRYFSSFGNRSKHKFRFRKQVGSHQNKQNHT